MKGVLTLIGAAAGAWRRSLGGMVLGAGVGWTLGALLTPRSRAAPPAAEEGHYVRYPEEEIVDALRAAEDEPAAEGEEMADLYREVAGER